MHVLDTYKFKMDQINSKREKVKSSIFLDLICYHGNKWSDLAKPQTLMCVIITCKYEKYPIKNSREKVETLFSHYKPMQIFADIQGQLTQQSVVQSG